MNILKILFFPIKMFLDNVFNPIYKIKLAKQIASICEKNSYILDYGCDDGSTAKLIQKFNPTLKIVGVDVQENRKPKIPIKIYNGKKIPYKDNEFEIINKGIKSTIQHFKRPHWMIVGSRYPNHRQQLMILEQSDSQRY